MHYSPQTIKLPWRSVAQNLCNSPLQTQRERETHTHTHARTRTDFKVGWCMLCPSHGTNRFRHHPPTKEKGTFTIAKTSKRPLRRPLTPRETPRPRGPRDLLETPVETEGPRAREPEDPCARLLDWLVYAYWAVDSLCFQGCGPRGGANQRCHTDLLSPGQLWTSSRNCVRSS